MDDAEHQQGDRGEDTPDNSDSENANTTPRRNHSNDNPTQMIRFYNLPEGTIADVQRFQQVCFQAR